MISFGRLHPRVPPHGLMKSSGIGSPLTIAWPSLMVSVSPGVATTRLMKFVSAGSSTGSGQGSPGGSGCSPQVSVVSAPFGGWKTTMSPISGSLKW